MAIMRSVVKRMRSVLLVGLGTGALYGQFGFPLGAFDQGLPFASLSQDFQPTESCKDHNGDNWSFFLFMAKTNCSGTGTGYRGHTGEDWAVKYGTDVYAIGPGQVVFARDLGGNWKKVMIIKHTLPDNSVFYSQYSHLSQFLAKESDLIATPRGKSIAKSGSAGNGPHLHLEVKQFPSNTAISAGPGYTQLRSVSGAGSVVFRAVTYLRPSAFINSHKSTVPPPVASFTMSVPGQAIVSSTTGTVGPANILSITTSQGQVPVITFNGGGSAGTGTLTYTWTSDGAVFPLNAPCTGPQCQFGLGAAGSPHNIVLIVKDSYGQTSGPAMAQVAVTEIPANPPIAGFLMTSGSQTKTQGQTLNVSVQPGMTATVQINGGSPYSFEQAGNIVEWDWSITGSGPELIKGTQSSLQRSWGAGTYNVSLVVKDSFGVSSQSVQGVVELATPQPLHQILSTGQSLSVGAGGLPVLSTNQPYRNVMLDQPDDTGAQLGTNLIPLIEIGTESMNSALANGITAQSANQSYRIASNRHGRGGYQYDLLKKGTPIFDRAITQMRNVHQAASAAGIIDDVVAVTAVHGEQDNVLQTPNYEADLVQWQQDYEQSAQSITGQTAGVPLFTDQTSSWSLNFSAPLIPFSQLAAAEDNPGKIYLVGPKYQFTYVDGIHLTNTNYRWLGEYYAKVMKRVLLDRVDWKPLSPRSITRAGTTISVDFWVPVPPLAFDVTQVPGVQDGKLGFEFYEEGETPPAISSVNITGPTSVTIQLSSLPQGINQRLRYAYSSIAGAGAGITPAPGSTVLGSPRGNLRDNDATPGSVGPLYNWCVHFDKPIVAPTAFDAPVTNVQLTNPTLTSLLLSWGLPTRSIQIAGYEIDVIGPDGRFVPGYQRLDVGNVTSFSLKGLSPATTYRVYVRVYDTAGNRYNTTDPSGAVGVTLFDHSLDPTSDSVTPASGTGSTQVFSFSYSHPKSVDQLSNVQFVFNTAPVQTIGCYVIYVPSIDGFYLGNDQQTYSGPSKPGSSGVMYSNQCSLLLGGSSVTRSGNTLTINVALTFTSGFAGTKTISMNAVNLQGTTSGWQTRGTWTVPASTPTVPTPVSVTPNSGSGSAQTFIFTYSQASGVGELLNVQALFNSAPNGTDICRVVYVPQTNGLYLYSDPVTYVGPLNPGSAGNLSNNQCTLSGTDSSVTRSGNTLTMNVALAFTAAFAGTKTVQANALNIQGTASGWQTLGSWTVPDPIPHPRVANFQLRPAVNRIYKKR